MDEFKRWTNSHGFTHVEVSDGTLRMERESKQELISALSEDFDVFYPLRVVVVTAALLLFRDSYPAPPDFKAMATPIGPTGAITISFSLIGSRRGTLN